MPICNTVTTISVVNF